MSRRLPVGPEFEYGTAPVIFSGRSGTGPLRIVIDTNILIDYLEYGPAMWEGEPKNIVDDTHAGEVGALETIINLWALRDIRFHVPEDIVSDAKRLLSAERQVARAKAVDQFAAALSYVGEVDADDNEAPQEPVPPAARAEALAAVPAGADRTLVDRAFEIGAHVFLTRDRGVLRAAKVAARAGLCIATPLDLLEELTACGALMCLLDRSYAYWPIPDLGRLPHLIDALGPVDG